MASWTDLLDKDHPIWKIAQMVLSLVGLVFVVYHGLGPAHHGIDTTDALGAVLGIKTLADARHFLGGK